MITPEAILAYLILGGAGLSTILLVIWLLLYLRQVQLGNRRSKLEIQKLELEIWHLAYHKGVSHEKHDTLGGVPVGQIQSEEP